MDTHAGDGGLHSFHDSVTGVTMFDGNSIAYEYDYLQRQSRKTVAGKLKETYAYAPGSGENTTTTRVSTKRNFWNGSLINQFQHGYDSLGNITSIYDAKTLQRVNYTYDDQNQLLKAVHIDNGTVTRTEVYTYDNVGNILTFNNGITSHTYTYGDENWKDLLTAVDGNAITYDASGNPTSYYNGYTMTWVEGRKLDTVTVNGQTYTYVYNSDGQRVKKINPDNSYVEYYVMDGVTVGESHFTSTGNKTLGIRYTLDENNSVIGLTINGVNYYFAKNLQGDVLAVYNATTNAVVAQYTYDSWGNILTATGNLAEINPFRYRTYYYDEETDFYYLQSRYYDAAVGRFINEDAFASTGQGLLGCNMFAYCGNNPITHVDYTGYIYLENKSDLVGVYGGGGSIISLLFPFTWLPSLFGFETYEYRESLALDEEEALVVVDVITEEPDKKVYFPANPYRFHPIGLQMHVCVTPGTGTNGGIIKWEIPGTKIAIFEWDEDWKKGPHYHALEAGWNNKHLGPHYPIGSEVPEPWKSLFFGV